MWIENTEKRTVHFEVSDYIVNADRKIKVWGKFH
jgi:hypothetical protein